MVAAMIKVGMGNGHNEESLVDWISDSNCHSFSAHESQRLNLEGRIILSKSYRITTPSKGWEAGDRARETAVLTRNNLTSLGEFTRQVSELVPAAERVAPDRAIAASMYRHVAATNLGWEGVVHIGAHLNAGPEALRGEKGRDNPILREYWESMESLVLYTKAFRNDGLLPIITGDLNLPDDVVRPWSPFYMLVEGLKMRYVSDGLDWILWDKDLKAVPGSLQKRRLFDHNGMAITLRGA